MAAVAVSRHADAATGPVGRGDARPDLQDREADAEGLGDGYHRTRADDLIEKLVVGLGRLGEKAGKGFYDCPADRPKYLWPGLAELAPRATEQPAVDELKKRFLYIQAMKTARCYEDNVVTAPEDVDVGAILGWGFAP